MKKQKLQKDWFRSKVLLVVVFILVLVAYKFAYDVFFLEGFCDQKAHQIVGKEWSKEIPATQFDKDRWPDTVNNDKIFSGVHEVLVCKDQHKPFIFF